MLIFRKSGVVPPGRLGYFQTETGTPFSGFASLRALAAEVKKHRDSNNIPVGTAFMSELSDWNCNRLDEETRAEWCMNEGENGGAPTRLRLPQRREEPTGFDGSKIWRALHIYALIQRPTAEQRAQYVAAIASQIPCGKCRRSWKQLVADNPLPPGASPEAFFEWSVDMHSRVSAKIGHPEMSLDAARDLWSG